jgi:CBS domain-containing protein
MKVKDVMTPNPACCLPDSSLREVAEIFVDHDCGAVPIVDSLESMKPIGIVTDRDIACRAIAKGKNALELKARDCMSSPSVTARPDASLNDCIEAMESNRVRRVLVVDEFGRCCGIVSQADIALRAGKKATAEVVREVSQPMASASSVAERSATTEVRH